jgi:hypothetical protein
MPTLTSATPDSLDLDYFLTKYPTSFGIAFNEETPTITHPIPAKNKPLDCFTKSLRSNTKITHFIKAPPTTAINFCLCNKYHVKFVAENNKLYNLPQTEFSPFVSNPKNKNTLKMISNISEITDRIPSSPTSATHQHTCSKCQLPITCKVSGNQHQLANDAKFQDNEAIHHSCSTPKPQTTSLTGSSTTSIFPHDYTSTKKKLTTTFQQSQKHATSIFNTTALPINNASIFPNYSYASTSTSSIQQSPTLPILNPTNFIHSNNPYMEIDTQQSSPLSNPKPPTPELNIQHLMTKTKTTLTTSTTNTPLNMEIDNSLHNIEITQNSNLKEKNNQDDNSNNTPITQTEPQVSTKILFDWFKNFPITEEMEKTDKLQTPLSFQLFELLKNNLHDFIPGKEIKPATDNRKALKTSFYHIIRKIAGQRPKFLTDLIYNSNPTISKEATIPFNTLESTLKKLILKFTTILFTKMNYSKIFASSLTIPPYTNKNRTQFCLNIARIHLYLSENYQTIDYIKFTEDFQPRPKRFTIFASTVTVDHEKPYLTIKHDLKFNIHLLFNLPKTQFLDKFNIPSLKNSLDHFDQWFEQFFITYNRQFEQSLNKTKVYNALKYQIRQQFITHLSKLLPTTYEIKEPQTFQERRDECIRYANFHVLTCKDENCSLLADNSNNPNNTANITIKKQHSSSILRRALEYSYQLFPKKENETWKQPILKDNLFNKEQKYEATFEKAIPTQLLDQLADQAEKDTCSQNKVITNAKRRNYYFYKYLELYHQAALNNSQLDNLTKDQIINKLLTKVVDTFMLARIITYFDIIQNQTTSYPNIIKYFNDNAYPSAHTLINEKFKINFEDPISLEDSLFLPNPSFQ